MRREAGIPSTLQREKMGEGKRATKKNTKETKKKANGSHRHHTIETYLDNATHNNKKASEREAQRRAYSQRYTEGKWEEKRKEKEKTATKNK